MQDVLTFELPHQAAPGGIQYRLSMDGATPILERKRYGQWIRLRFGNVHLALVLMVLRERAARVKAEQHNAHTSGQAERSKDLDLELARIRAIQDRLGARGTT